MLGIGQRVFEQQRIGLGDGGQRVAYLVRDACRYAPHRRELLLVQARLRGAHVLEQQHAEFLDRAPALLHRAAPREAHPQAQGARVAHAEVQHHVGAGLGPVGLGQRALHRGAQ